MYDRFNVNKKVICIIGGTGLIGSELVKEFAQRKALCFVGTRNPEKYKSSANIKYLGIDMRSTASIKNFIKKVKSSNKKIDAWINCALPKFETAKGNIEDIDSEIIAQATQDHLIGFYRCCKEILPVMKKQKSGSIINFGSIYGDLSADFRIYKNTEIKKSPAYFLSEGGIHMLTKLFACYGATYNVRVNAICPGGVFDGHSKIFKDQYSQRIPLGRMAKPDDLRGPVLFLASDASSYVTGHLLFVDGGLRAW